MSYKLINIFNKWNVQRNWPIIIYKFYLEKLNPCLLPRLQSVQNITFRFHFKKPMFINSKYYIPTIVIYLLSQFMQPIATSVKDDLFVDFDVS